MQAFTEQDIQVLNGLRDSVKFSETSRVPIGFAGAVLGRGSSGLVREGRWQGKIIAAKTPVPDQTGDRAYSSASSSYQESCSNLEDELAVYRAIAALSGLY